MTKKEKFLSSAVGILFGLVGGIAGASFAIGVDKQKTDDALSANSAAITKVEITTNKYFEQLQSSIEKLGEKVNDLRGDVKVLQTLVDLLEQNLQPKPKP